MMRPRIVLAIAALAAFGAVFAGQPANAGSVRVGVLMCDVAGGIGLIVTSSRDLDCDLELANGENHRYTGTMRKFGLDVGFTTGGKLAWAVFAPNWTVAYGALAGSYVGGTAGAAVGGGVGANALIGGGEKSFALQPLSVEGSVGLNVAAGVGAMTLRTVRE